MRSRTKSSLRSAVLIASLVLSGCGLHGRPKVDRSKALAGGPSSPSAISPELAVPSRVVAPGIVQSSGGDVALSPKESGWIARILVEEGQRVESGQVLAVLDDEKEQAGLESAEADFTEAEAVLARAVHGPSAEELQAARAEADAARARATLASLEATRVNGLAASGAAGAADVERRDIDSRVEDALARATEARLAALRRGTRREDKDALRARSAAAKARLALARAGVARRQVVAPKASTVLFMRSHVGEYFGVGGPPMFVVGDTSKLEVRLEVDEIDSLRVSVGASCTILGDDNVKITEGTVLRLAPLMGRRGLSTESPTSRADVRVREVFIQLPGTTTLIPGQRVWGHVASTAI